MPLTCYVLKTVFNSKSDNIHKTTDKISQNFILINFFV